MNDLKKLIREVPDYPKPGILFYDLTTLLKDKDGFHTLIDRLCEHFRNHTVDVVAGIEARGFIFAPALAYRLGAGFVPVRKPRKLPAKAAAISYALEYGTDTLEIHEDAIKPGDRVIICDDLLATGGEQIVADDDTVTGFDGVFVDFQGVGAVFKGVGNCRSFCRKFSWFAHRNEARTQAISQRRRKDKTTGFYAGDDVDRVIPEVFAQPVDQGVEAVLVLQ